MTYEQECEIFKNITDRMNDVFERKRHDYGPTSEHTYKKFGLVSMYIRMYDKLGRLESLCQKEPKVVEESVEDTLLDLANYAVITLLEVEKDKMQKCQEEIKPICDWANTRR
jgi:hypothetical protein